MPRRRPSRSRPKRGEFATLSAWLAGIAIAGVLLRSFVAAPFVVPSESMVPALLPGDYVLAAKWPYGFSRYSLPGSVPLLPHRIFAKPPRRGEIVVFKPSAEGRNDYVKRVIGLPGDRVALRDGALVLNGKDIPRTRIADLMVGAENLPCAVREAGECRLRRYRETLPEGRTFEVIDEGDLPAADDMRAIRVPADMMFVLGDNRDRSRDSRFAVGAGGVGLVPQDRLVARAGIVIFSTDGSAQWGDPASWLSAIRWERIGRSL